MSSTRHTIPARRGKAARVAKGQTIRVVNTHGEQVVDTWAFAAGDLGENLSMAATRNYLQKLCPEVGDTLMTRHRRPILTLVADTSPGRHDTLMAACDRHRYALLGVAGYHDNCADNFAAALGELGLAPPPCPDPLNLFMNIPWTAAGALVFEAPLSQPGDYVDLRAEMDLVVAFSACPQDILPINGRSGMPTEAHFAIRDP